jgi:hypothetical protein
VASRTSRAGSSTGALSAPNQLATGVRRKRHATPGVEAKRLEGFDICRRGKAVNPDRAPPTPFHPAHAADWSDANIDAAYSGVRALVLSGLTQLMRQTPRKPASNGG